jgi:hypothetical protein
MELDLFIEKFYSFIFDNLLSSIRTFAESESIKIKFYKDRSLKLDYNEIHSNEIKELYTRNQFNILKIFHNDIGNYLKKNLEGLRLEWNVNIHSTYIYVKIVYYNDLDVIRKFSKKLDEPTKCVN